MKQRKASVYRITGWNKHFENNRTRELKVMAWIPVPNKMDGDGYTELMEHPDGAAHFGAWYAILEVASKCDPRGTLLRNSGRPHDSASLSRITRIPTKVFDDALPRLVSIGWIETYEIPQEGAGIPQEPAAHRTVNGTERNGTERNGMEKKDTAPEPAPAVSDSRQFNSSCPTRKIVEAWNETALREGFRLSKTLGDDQRKSVNSRWRDPFWRENWRAALAKTPAIPFLHGQNDRGWKATLDWFLKKVTVRKLIEDQYPTEEEQVAGAPKSRDELEMQRNTKRALELIEEEKNRDRRRSDENAHRQQDRPAAPGASRIGPAA